MKPGKWDDDVTDISLSGVFDLERMRSSYILRILLKKDLENFKKRLYELRLFSWYPLYIPVTYIEMKVRGFPEAMARIRRFLYRVKKTTGTHKNYSRKLGLTKSIGRSLQEVWDDPDFEIAPAELTSIASDCAYYESACRTHQSLLNAIEAMNQGLMSTSHSSSFELVGRMLERKTSFIGKWMTEVQNRSTYLGERAEVQVQTVCNHVSSFLSYHRRYEALDLRRQKLNKLTLQCLSLMAQRDNALNKRTSDASLEVSRFSKMDSNDMRTIAAVTLAFLPATFMAIYALLILPTLPLSSTSPLSPLSSTVSTLVPLKIQIEILPVLPFWAIVSFGAYLMGRLGVGVLKFKNVDSAYEELMGQLEGSRNELGKRGVGYD
ncbi:MAG: hypothetical protein Q9160_007715 [Pyrenula sp. 1 TL-2023]